MFFGGRWGVAEPETDCVGVGLAAVASGLPPDPAANANKIAAPAKRTPRTTIQTVRERLYGGRRPGPVSHEPGRRVGCEGAGRAVSARGAGRASAGDGPGPGRAV